jgi:hypothetical protein
LRLSVKGFSPGAQGAAVSQTEIAVGEQQAKEGTKRQVNLALDMIIGRARSYRVHDVVG